MSYSENQIRALGVLVLVFVAVGFAEVASYFAGRYLRNFGVFYPKQNVDDVDDYLAKRHPVLGWPALTDTAGRDASGSRSIPAFPTPGNACISLYGDSFTQSTNDDEHTWSNVLSELLDCRVSNFGIGGYGSDQALIRFEENVDDEAGVVILGHLSENIIRNLNQNRSLMGSRWGLKPRFILDGSEEGLTLVPLPGSSAEEAIGMMQAPELHLEHEYFRPGGPSGLRRLTFPYVLSMLRLVNDFHVRSKIVGISWHAEFYEDDHPSRGLEVTARIVARFHRVAVERGKVPVGLLIPTPLDLEYFKTTGTWVYGSLLERVSVLGYEMLDLSPLFLEALGERDYGELFENQHPNAEGDALLAGFVRDHLHERGLFSSARATL